MIICHEIGEERREESVQKMLCTSREKRTPKFLAWLKCVTFHPLFFLTSQSVDIDGVQKTFQFFQRQKKSKNLTFEVLLRKALLKQIKNPADLSCQISIIICGMAGQKTDLDHIMINKFLHIHDTGFFSAACANYYFAYQTIKKVQDFHYDLCE